MDILHTSEFENEKRYKDLFDNAHDLIHIALPDGRLLYANASWIKVLEYTQDEIQGQSIYSFVDDKDRGRFVEYRQASLEGQSHQSISVSLRRKNGEEVIVEGFVSAKIKDGRPAYTTGIFRDITQKVKNERQLQLYNEQLQEREYNLQQLLLFAPDAIIVIDAAGKVLFWNPKAEAIFGWTEAEMQGRLLTETIIPPQYREAHNNGMRRYLTTGEARVLNRTIDVSALHKNGNEFYISLTISTTRQKGQLAFIAFIRDTSEQRIAELELEKKRKQLEESNQQLEQFAHVASHDMKEPIRKITLYSGRLEDEDLSANAKNYLQKIQDAAKRLTNMVEGVLKYATASSAADEKETIQLKEIIKSIGEDLELVIAQKKAVIECSEFPPFKGVPFLIYQLFYNLINNSLKFSKEHVPPHIKIKAAIINNDAAGKEASYIQFLVVDNGIGFEKEYASLVFNTFTRLHPKDKYEGTGLGLALCKNIVEKHGGTITASGEKNKGATFTILLPVE